MRNFALSIIALLVLAAPAFGSDPSSFGLAEDPVTSTFYRCFTDPAGGAPRCFKINSAGQLQTIEESAESLDWPTFLAAIRTARTGVSTPILTSDSGPIEACANTHGGGGCCRVVERYPLLMQVVIECG